MRMDLKLLPLLGSGANRLDFWMSHDILRLDRRMALWPEIEALPQEGIPRALTCHFARTGNGISFYGSIENNPHNERLKWTTAGSLMTLGNHDGVRSSWLNRAAWAYLHQMPTDWKIVLYWC